MKSITKYFDQLNTPAPELPDIEDDIFEEPWTKRSKHDSIYETDLIETGRSTNAVVDFNGLNSQSYSGKKVRVREFFDDEGIVGLAAPAKFENQVLDMNDELVMESEESEDEESASEIASSSNDESVDVDDEKIDEADSLIVMRNAETDHGKAESIRQQFLIYDSLMQLQIKVHAALRNFNRLPRGELAKELFKGSTHEAQTVVQKVRKKTRNLVEKLMELEDVLISTSKQTNKILVVNEDGKGNVDPADEEITSSDDDGDVDDDHKSKNIGSKSEPANHEISKFEFRKKMSLKNWKNAVNAELEFRDDRYKLFRISSISDWDEKTKFVSVLASAKKDFSKFDSEILKQIERIMAEKHRLIRRTQLKRSDIERIGCENEATHDVEIFDDDDFYQQLLKDIIEKKSAQTVDPIEMSKQWLEIQNLRQKRSKKKKVDTRASKGRKTRYVAIPQLLNFVPSESRVDRWSNSMRDQLIKSLFS